MLRHLWSKTYTVNCPDGPRTVHHNVDDVFPLHLKFAKQSAGISVNGLNKLKATVDFKAEEKVAAVLVGIDRTNQSMQTQFRAAYAIFQASPCTELPYLKGIVESIIVEEHKLRAVEAIISQIISIYSSRPKSAQLDLALASQIDGHLSQALTTLLPENRRMVTEKMALVSGNTQMWSEDDA